MIEIKEIVISSEKAEICSSILRALPGWFGIEASIADYIDKVGRMPFYAVFDCDKAVGFVAIKVHNRFTAEIFVIGVLGDYHRQRIGKRLVEICEMYCKENNMEFLTVKTLDASKEDEGYEKTRLFYQSVGFKPLEVLTMHWGADNPCLFMVKYINL